MNKKVSRSSAKKEEKIKQQAEYPSNLTQREVRMLLYQINIVLYYQDKESPGEMIQTQPVGVNSYGQIDLPRLVELLKANSFLQEKCSISYLLQGDSEGNDVYVYCGDTSRLDKATNIPLTALNSYNQLKLKIRKNKRSLVDSLLEEQKKYLDKEPEEKGGLKQKYKKIGYVVEKVALWRRFYTGFYDERGNFIQKPLEQAAYEVGIAKKTLDDYLLQIRCGKKFGFNFNDNVENKIGDLRAFVRDEKKKYKKEPKD